MGNLLVMEGYTNKYKSEPNSNANSNQFQNQGRQSYATVVAQINVECCALRASGLLIGAVTLYKIIYTCIFTLMSSIYQPANNPSHSVINIKDVPRSSIYLQQSTNSRIPSSHIIPNQRDVSMDFGSFRAASLANLVSPQERNLSSPSLKCLATFRNNKMLLNPQQLKWLDEAYPNNLLAFYAVYGSRKSGKSFWCDRTYDLSDVGGGNAHFYTRNDLQKGIYYLDVPFTKGNLKIFLLDCTGFDRQELTREEEIRLDTIMTLSSAVLIIPDPDDHQCKIMKTAYQHFYESQQRLQFNGQSANKKSSYWPLSCYCLYRSTEPVSKQTESLGNLFQDYNFTIIHDAKNPKFQGSNQDLISASFLNVENSFNEHYLTHLSYVTRDVYDKIWGKRFGNLRSNGRVVYQMLPQLSAALNLKEKVQLDKVFQSTTNILYDDSLKRSSVFYSQAVKDSFRDINPDKPVGSQILLKSVNEAREKTFNYYDNESMFIDPESRKAQETSHLLDEFIGTQQYKFYEANKRASIRTLESAIPSSKNEKVDTIQDFRVYIKKLRYTHPEIDQGRSEVVLPLLKEACQNSRTVIFTTNEQAERLHELERQNDRKRAEILSLEKKIREKSTLDQKDSEQLVILTTKSKKYDEEIERLKKRNQYEQELLKNPNTEEVDHLRMEQLRKTKLELESRLKEAEREKSHYQSWHADRSNLSNEAIISTLNSKLNEKKKQKELKQSVFLNSQLTSKLIGQSTRSIERRPINESTIKRSRYLA